MKFVATNTAEQLDLQALHRVRERLVIQRTGLINQIRAFLLERALPCVKACASSAPSYHGRRLAVCAENLVRLIW